MLVNLSRKEIKSKIQEVYRASKEVIPSFSKADFSVKEFREKLKKGYTFNDFAEEYPKVQLPDLTFEGESRYDDLVRVTSGTNYPKVLLDLVGTNKDVALAFSELDNEIATFDEQFEKEFAERYLKHIPFKNVDPSKLDWNYIFKVVPSYFRPQLEQLKMVYETIEVPKPNLEHILDLYDEEIEAYINRYDKESEFLKNRIEFYKEEIERSHDFYELLPSMTLRDLFDMEPEIYEMALDELERKITTVGWDPNFELSPEQQKDDDLARRALGLKSLPDVPTS